MSLHLSSTSVSWELMTLIYPCKFLHPSLIDTRQKVLEIFRIISLVLRHEDKFHDYFRSSTIANFCPGGIRTCGLTVSSLIVSSLIVSKSTPNSHRSKITLTMQYGSSHSTAHQIIRLRTVRSDTIIIRSVNWRWQQFNPTLWVSPKVVPLK